MRFVARYGRYGIQLRPMIAGGLRHRHVQRSSRSRSTRSSRRTSSSPRPRGRAEDLGLVAGLVPGAGRGHPRLSRLPHRRLRHRPGERARAGTRTRSSGSRSSWSTTRPVTTTSRSSRTRFVDPPWPNYDTFKGSIPALMRKLVEEGHDLKEVLAYEHAVQGRGKVVQAIEELLLIPRRSMRCSPSARRRSSPDERALAQAARRHRGQPAPAGARAACPTGGCFAASRSSWTATHRADPRSGSRASTALSCSRRPGPRLVSGVPVPRQA